MPLAFAVSAMKASSVSADGGATGTSLTDVATGAGATGGGADRAGGAVWAGTVSGTGLTGWLQAVASARRGMAAKRRQDGIWTGHWGGFGTM